MIISEVSLLLLVIITSAFIIVVISNYLEII